MRKKGFTLIELLITISIIGILAGVVVVSSRGGLEKAREASAVSTASSALTELVTCADDYSGVARSGLISSSMYICCTGNDCTTAVSGHTARWPDLTSTGWQYGNGSGTLSAGSYSYVLTKNIEGTDYTITCNISSGDCTSTY